MVNQTSKKRSRNTVTPGKDKNRKLRIENNAQKQNRVIGLGLSSRSLSQICLFVLGLFMISLALFHFFSTPAISSTEDTIQTPAASEEEKKPSLNENNKGRELQNKAENFKSTIHNVLSPMTLNFKGRNIELVELKHSNKKSSVHVYVADNFLSKRECDGLSDAHLNHVTSSSRHFPIVCFANTDTMTKHLREVGYKYKAGLSDFTNGTLCINATFSQKIAPKFKYSYSTAFYRSESKFAAQFEEQIEAVTRLAKMHGGKFQITSYQNGVGYKNHTDCTEDSEIRDRFATVLVYLKDVKEGGETKFPKLGINVKPKQGRILVWNNMRLDGSCDPTSIHNAAKVEQGHKIIIQRWYYYKNFYSLGKRPAEPSIPERQEFQPRVSCDEFAHGSCRWYDEWGYDHLINYQLSKSNLS